WVLLLHDTYSTFAFASMAISVGWLAVFHTLASLFVSRSITATPAFAHKLTNSRLPPGSTTAVYGYELFGAGFAPASSSSAGFGSSFFGGSLRPSGGLGGSPFSPS